MTLDELKKLLTADQEMMAILRIIDGLGLPDAWLAAGMVRNFIWNSLSNQRAFDRETDLDLVFFDPAVSYEESLALEADLQARYPDYQWEVKNQVYMHRHSPKTSPYTSARDAITKYPERCTAIAIKLDAKGQVQVFAPYGLDDIISFTIRPTPHFLADPDRLQVYQDRLAKKNWQQKWPSLKIVDS